MPRPFSEMYKKKCKMLRDKYKKCPQQVFDTSCEQLK